MFGGNTPFGARFIPSHACSRNRSSIATFVQSGRTTRTPARSFRRSRRTAIDRSDIGACGHRRGIGNLRLSGLGPDVLQHRDRVGAIRGIAYERGPVRHGQRRTSRADGREPNRDVEVLHDVVDVLTQVAVRDELRTGGNESIHPVSGDPMCLGRLLELHEVPERSFASERQVEEVEE